MKMRSLQGARLPSRSCTRVHEHASRSPQIDRTGCEASQSNVCATRVARRSAKRESDSVAVEPQSVPSHGHGVTITSALRASARFLILGSADPRLVRGVSESLAGRVHHVDVAGFDLSEVGVERTRSLWLRGGFPRSFLARSSEASLSWRRDYIRDFLHRDLGELGVTIPAVTLGRFWNMVAHFHGGLWNGADFARSLGASESTARRYLDLLSGAWAVRQLQPWFENTRKRQVKAPKVYVQDTGLLHALLDLQTEAQLMGHPKAGASWEGFVLGQVLALLGGRDAYFWRTHQGAELDLLLMRGGKRYGFEMKLGDAPTLTKSMHIALADLKLSRLFVVYPGVQSYDLDDKVEVVSISELPRRLRALG